MTTLERALNSIGKKCFVDYYESFRDCVDEKALAQQLLNENPNASSLLAQQTRVNNAKWIFHNNLESDALDIILGSTRLDNQTINKARQIRSLLK